MNARQTTQNIKSTSIINVVSIEFIHSVQGHREYQSTKVCGKVHKYGRVYIDRVRLKHQT